MSSRERNLTILVGAAAGFCVLIWGGGKYRSYYTDLTEQKKKKLAAIDDVNKEITETKARKTRWQQLGSETLSNDPNRILNLFRSEADQLLKDCALEERSVTLGKMSNLGKNVRGQKEYVRVLSATVRGQGRAEDIMRFLYRLYAEPYAVRVKTLTLSRPGRNAPRGTLVMNATVETPILPLTKMPIVIQQAKLEPYDRKEMPRTASKNFDDYRKGVVRRKLFDPYEKIVAKAVSPNPAPGAVLLEETSTNLMWQPYKDASEQKLYFAEGGVPSTQPVITLSGNERVFRPDVKLQIDKTYAWRIDTEFEDELTVGDTWTFSVRKKPVPPPVASQPVIVQQPPPVVPPADADFVVSRLISSPLSQQVVLEDRRNPQVPVEKRVEVGQELYDGTLIYIHAKGAVSAKEGKWRMHPVGEVVRNLQPLTENDPRFPDVYAELVKLQKEFVGITQRPDAGETSIAIDSESQATPPVSH